MPYSGGVYTSPSNSWNPAVTGTAINATDWAAQLADLATALTTCVLKDGTQTITANLPMGGYKFTGLAGGSTAGDSLRYEQLVGVYLQLAGGTMTGALIVPTTDLSIVDSSDATKKIAFDASGITTGTTRTLKSPDASGTLALATAGAPWAVAGGTVSAITATYSPVNLSLTDGLLLAFRSSGANTSTTPTFAPDGLTAHTITKIGGSALLVGDLPPSLGEVLVRYNLANTRWELLNPVVGTSGTSTLTLTGCTTAPTVTAVWSITNNVVTLFVPLVTATSNTTACTLTGLAAAATPATTHSQISCTTTDNGTSLLSSIDVGSNGVITLRVGAGSTVVFTNSGTKGIAAGFTISYNLN